MSFPRALQAVQPAERRAFGRAKADCAAMLRTPTNEWHGRLWDLSEAGARVQVEEPPTQGDFVILKWLSYEAVSRVVWCSTNMCGLAFERTIDPSVVSATVGGDEPTDPGPAASVGNIPVGTRRSRLGSFS